MAHFLIVADMAGVSGIETLEACMPGHPEYPDGTALLTAEVNALASAAYQSGASAVSVIDWHGDGRNLREDRLDTRVRVAPRDLSSGYAAAFLTGFHSMAGTRPGFASQTMAPGMVLELNGQPVGELGLVSRWLGEHEIPMALITGDRAASLEAEAFVFDTPTLTVKQARSWDRADSLPVERAHEVLRAAVTRVLGRRDRWRIYRPELPARIRLRVRHASDLVAKIPGLTREEGGWFTVVLPTINAVIDLVELVAALLAADQQAGLLGTLAADPAAASTLDQARREELALMIRENPWT
ncbi:MAG TPA: M55 family metallopeptidase [Nitrolancea sp.]|nr:M55 family metallopeptidase [Nitrolancea sp.]